jgi:hypothetical protein
MKFLINYVLALAMVLQSLPLHAAGRIQNEDVKSLADITSASGKATGNLTLSSACISSLAFTKGALANLAAGMFVYDTTTSTNIASGTTITAIPGTCSAGQIQMSANAVAAATGDTITFGGQLSQLINDSKLYVSANGINDTLANAITNGALGSSGGGVGVELLSNPNFEQGTITQGWSSTGGSAALVTSGANLIEGKKSASWTPSASGQIFQSAAVAIQGLAGGNCSASIGYYYAGTASDYTFKVIDGSSNVLATKALPLSAASTSGVANYAASPLTVTFPCGSASTSTVKWQLVSAVASPAVINFDKTHLGGIGLYTFASSASTPTTQTFLSGSGTYTLPAGVSFIEVRMVGGGGGGGGSGTSVGTAGSNGGDTTFGTSLLTAGGGVVGSVGLNGPNGGTPTIAAGPIPIFKVIGGSGNGGAVQNAGVTAATPTLGGMPGGVSFLGGSGGAGSGNGSVIGLAAAANTGGGGGGAGVGAVNGAANGPGGGAGAYIDAIITSPSSTYSYAVGTAGTGEGAGANGFHGGNGGSGYLSVTEYYGLNANAAINPALPVLPTKTIITTSGCTPSANCSGSNYIVPAGATQLVIKMAGGGGGGSGGGTGGNGPGGNGNSSVFGTSLLVANGGVGGNGILYGSGGTSSISSPATGTPVSGNFGSAGGNETGITAQFAGGSGGATVFGGAGSGGYGGNTNGSAGIAGAANSGSGGGGAGGGNTAGTATGGGGGAGGYVDALLSVSGGQSYAFSVATGGTAGSAGSNGSPGGAGGSGYIEITESYQSGYAPILIGGVTTGNTSGAEIMNRAKITLSSGGTCTVNSQSGSWISSAVRTAAGRCTLTVSGYSAVPTCTFSVDETVSPGIGTVNTTSTSTSLLINSLNASTSAYVDGPLYMICVGPK